MPAARAQLASVGNCTLAKSPRGLLTALVDACTHSNGHERRGGAERGGAGRGRAIVACARRCVLVLSCCRCRTSVLTSHAMLHTPCRQLAAASCDATCCLCNDNAYMGALVRSPSLDTPCRPLAAASCYATCCPCTALPAAALCTPRMGGATLSIHTGYR